MSHSTFRLLCRTETSSTTSPRKDFHMHNSGRPRDICGRSLHTDNKSANHQFASINNVPFPKVVAIDDKRVGKSASFRKLMANRFRSFLFSCTVILPHSFEGKSSDADFQPWSISTPRGPCSVGGKAELCRSGKKEFHEFCQLTWCKAWSSNPLPEW